MIDYYTISQICANAIVTSSVIALVGIGFALVYFVGRFLNFAHGVIFSCGAYFTFMYSSHFGLSLTSSIILAFCSTTILGCMTEILIYRPLREKSVSPLVMLLTSLGVYVVIQNFLSISFGDDLKVLYFGSITEGNLILGARVTDIQILTVCVCAVFVAALTVVMKWTRIGITMRAIGCDSELAMSLGINKNRVMLWCVALSSALAGAAGILVALDVGMVPTMGMDALMMAVVAVIVGGIGSIPGLIFAALLVGFARHIGTWSIGSQWQDSIAFVILLTFLLVRPEGFMGKKVRKTTV